MVNMGRRRKHTDKRVGLYIQAGTRQRLNDTIETVAITSGERLSHDDMVNNLLDLYRINNIPHPWSDMQGDWSQFQTMPLQVESFPTIVHNAVTT
jgi:hypothetical protein